MTEVGERVADLVEAFDDYGGDELAGFECGEGGAAVYCWWGEVLWVGGGEAGEDVDLSEREGDT